MNIEVPANLCTDLHTAKVGDLVVLIDRDGYTPRLVTRVTPKRVSIQNGGGVGTLKTFNKHDGRLHPADAFRDERIVGPSADRYDAIAKVILKKQLAESIARARIGESCTFEKVVEAARLLDVNPKAFELPAVY